MSTCSYVCWNLQQRVVDQRYRFHTGTCAFAPKQTAVSRTNRVQVAVSRTEVDRSIRHRHRTTNWPVRRTSSGQVPGFASASAGTASRSTLAAAVASAARLLVISFITPCFGSDSRRQYPPHGDYGRLRQAGGTRSVWSLVRPSESRSESVTGVVPFGGRLTANAPFALALQPRQVPAPMRRRQRALASETLPLTRTSSRSGRSTGCCRSCRQAVCRGSKK